jgi:preprotein translocase subunit YajC
MLELLLILAQQDGGKGAPSPLGSELLLIMMVVFALLWLIVIRPSQKRQERERQALLNSMKKNDKVLTTAGIYGTVVSVSDKEDEVVVKVDDNTRLKMLKSSIMRNFTAEEARKAEADKAKETGIVKAPESK